MDFASSDFRIPNQDVITKIENVFHSIVDALQQKRKLSITILAKRHSGPPKEIMSAASKGLVSGEFSWEREDQSIIWRQPDDPPMLIDYVLDNQQFDVSRIAWILVIEKESTFRTLASSKLHQNCKAGKGIIMTAKGYPDLSSRAFLRLLSMNAKQDGGIHSLPIYALVDFDPDGIGIMSTYKHGSQNLSHENPHLNVPCIQWLGIKSGDLGNKLHLSDGKGLLPLTVRDRKKAMSLLGKDRMTENGMEREWRRELQVMLMLNVKAEMELLDEREGGLEDWVEDSLLARMGGGKQRANDDDDVVMENGLC